VPPKGTCPTAAYVLRINVNEVEAYLGVYRWDELLLGLRWYTAETAGTQLSIQQLQQQQQQLLKLMLFTTPDRTHSPLFLTLFYFPSSVVPAASRQTDGVSADSSTAARVSYIYMRYMPLSWLSADQHEQSVVMRN